MPISNAAWLAAFVILVIDAFLVVGLVGFKVINRARERRLSERRGEYRRLISRHLAFENCTDPITPKMVTDPAFIDALLEVRNALSGDEGNSLPGVVDRQGLTSRQVARLHSRFPLGKRLRAAVILAELGASSSAEALMEHLDDRVPEIRIQAARGLARMKWTPALDAIVSRFSVETPLVRNRFADTLPMFGSDATWPLAAYVKVNHEFDSEGPVAAIRALGTIGDVDAVQPLVEVLQEADSIEVKLATVETLGLLGSPLALSVLRSTARSGDWRVRAKSMTALAEIGDPRSLEILGPALRDRDWWVRRNAAAGLTRIRGGIDLLYDAIATEDHFAADAAAEALEHAGELAAARQRESSGGVLDRDLLLIHHMAGVR